MTISVPSKAVAQGAFTLATAILQGLNSKGLLSRNDVLELLEHAAENVESKRPHGHQAAEAIRHVKDGLPLQ